MRRPIDEPVRITGDRASHAAYNVGPATDYGCDIGTPVLAPFDGDMSTYVTSVGGLGVIVRGADATFYGQHLWVRMSPGHYAEGERIALSGNSGTQTTGPHLHCYVIVHATGERLAMEEYLTRAADAGAARPFDPTPEEQEETDMRIYSTTEGKIKFAAPGAGTVHVKVPSHVVLLQRLIANTATGERERETFNPEEDRIIGCYLRGMAP